MPFNPRHGNPDDWSAQVVLSPWDGVECLLLECSNFSLLGQESPRAVRWGGESWVFRSTGMADPSRAGNTAFAIEYELSSHRSVDAMAPRTILDLEPEGFTLSRMESREIERSAPDTRRSKPGSGI